MSTSPTKAGAHTPGPWSVGGPTGKLNQIAINPCIGCAYGAGDEVAANAALIAAAPLMLGALRRLVRSMDAHSTLHAEDGDDVARMLEWAAAADEARAAIAAAQGDAS